MKKNALFASGLALVSAVLATAQLPIPLNTSPSRIVGHVAEPLDPITNAPNLVEGRELWLPRGLAIDNSVSPPRLYVADTLNNRVLGWKNALAFRNGQVADIVIGQQDLRHTKAGGPGTTFSAGLSSPASLLVDANGNLFVADVGNNRILRFPRPFDHAGDETPDLHVGQPRFDTAAANFTGAVSDQGLSLAGSLGSMAFDGDGNLWVADAGNRRVVRFDRSDLSAAVNNDVAPHANVAIGQLDLASVQTGVTVATRTTNNAFATLTSVAFDAAGRLYAADVLSDGSGRVLVFNPPFANGAQPATRIAGVFPDKAPSQDALDKTVMLAPTSIFFANGRMGVLDSNSNRILFFDTVDKWPDATTTFSPLAISALGQPDLHNRGVNGKNNTWAGSPDSLTFNTPLAAVVSGNELYVADTGNNRVLVLPAAGLTFGPATRILGQDSASANGPNLVEGREFALTRLVSGGRAAEGGIAMDETTDTPHLYVADTFNNRVLGFRDFRKAQAGSKADLVIGQPDLSSNLCNVDGNPDGRTAASLCGPTGLAVDAQGNLYVADSGNGRVLRFPAPFAHPTQLPQADLVLGQRSFTSRLADPSQSTMSQPYGLAISGADGLFVSDADHNRVLFFAFTSGGSFSAGTDNGRAATKVFGQADFRSNVTGAGDASMNAPRHIAADNEGRLYVADTSNNRVLIFDQINLTPTSGAHAALSFSASAPRAVFVNQGSSEIWVAEAGSRNIKRYPRYANLILNPSANYTVVAGDAGLAVTQDQFGDLIVADASSRVQFYFPGVSSYNGGHFLPSRMNLAPGLLSSLCSPGSACGNTKASLFGTNTAALDTYPMPTTLGDVQVLFGPAGGDLQPAPLYYVSPSQINFVVPMNAPQSGLVDIQIWQPSTGRIFAAGQAPMNTVAPAVLMLQYEGQKRQAAVINEDGTVNSTSNPAKRGSYVSMYATGQGFVKGAPADGVPPTAAVWTSLMPRVNINGAYLDDMVKNPEDKPKDQWIVYSGLSGFPGLWQINFYIPSGVAAGSQIPLILMAGNSVLSTDGTFVTTIAVK